MRPLVTEAPIQPELLATFAERRRVGGVAELEVPAIYAREGVVEQHGKIESALLLEPSLLDGLDDLPMRTALLMPFFIRADGSTVRTGPKEMVRLGAREGSFERRNTDVSKRRLVDDWCRMYHPLEDGGFGLAEKTNTQAAARFRLYRAPSIREGQRFSTDQWRTSTFLKEARIPNVMVPMRYLREPATVRRLSAVQLRSLFALHALSDREVYGGVDPNHLCVRDGLLTVSADLAERIGEADKLLGLLTELEGMGELEFVPVELRILEFFPAARPHIQYVGDDDSSSDMVIRLTRAIVRGPAR